MHSTCLVQFIHFFHFFASNVNSFYHCTCSQNKHTATLHQTKQKQNSLSFHSNSLVKSQRDCEMNAFTTHLRNRLKPKQSMGPHHGLFRFKAISLWFCFWLWFHKWTVKSIDFTSKILQKWAAVCALVLVVLCYFWGGKCLEWWSCDVNDWFESFGGWVRCKNVQNMGVQANEVSSVFEAAGSV